MQKYYFFLEIVEYYCFGEIVCLMKKYPGYCWEGLNGFSFMVILWRCFAKAPFSSVQFKWLNQVITAGIKNVL